MGATLLHDMFVLTIPLAEKVLRPVVVYVFLIVGLRVAGKRELAQLNPFDLVVLLTLSNTVQNAIIGDDNTVTGGIVAAATLLAVNYAVVRYLYSHPTLDRLVQGNPDVLLANGRVMTDRLRRQLITLPEFKAAAHKQGFSSLDEVDRAILDPGGTIRFIAKKPSEERHRPRTLPHRLDALERQLTLLRPPSTS